MLGSQPDFGYGLLSSDFVKFNLKIASSSKMGVARLGSVISATPMVGIHRVDEFFIKLNFRRTFRTRQVSLARVEGQ